MVGEHDDGGPQVPDYAGKEGGKSGGPGGHARERLDELIAQRFPATHNDADAEPSDADCEPDEELADEQSEQPEQELDGSAEGEPHTEGVGP